MPSHDETSPVGSGRRLGPPASARPPRRSRARPDDGVALRLVRLRRQPPAGQRRRPAPRERWGRSRRQRRRERRRKGKPARTKKQRRRRRLKILAGLVAGLFVLLAVFVGVVYATTEVPDPNSVQNAQTTVVYYADGTTEMARLGDENRTNVTLDQVSEPARNAILAAENRNFYSDPGISFTGIVRAAWNNVTGGSTQGGSTITQQYVKNAFLTSEQTFSRKFQELFLAIKLDNEYSKDEIFENYLNTIYFGRGAYGIEAAANTFFGVPASALTAEQGAVLAVLIRNPSGNDPEVNPEGALSRWERRPRRHGGGGLAHRRAARRRASTRRSCRAPGPTSASPRARGPGRAAGARTSCGPRATPTSRSSPAACGSPRRSTSPRRTPRSPRSTTSCRASRATCARRWSRSTRGPAPSAPTTAGRAAPDFDYAQAQRQPGSSMKPYVLATALQQGIGVESRRDGSSPQEFPDREAPVRNSGGASCGNCTLVEAMTRSLNTTFYGLALRGRPGERAGDGAGRRRPAGVVAGRRPRSDAGQRRRLHRLGHRHRRVRDAPDRPGARLRHPRRRRRGAHAVLRRPGHRHLRGGAAGVRRRPRRAGHPAPTSPTTRPSRSRASPTTRGARWTATGRWPARPVPRG